MDLMTKDQAAELLGISRDTLDTLMKQRKITYYQLSPKIVRFDREDVLEYIRLSCVEAAEPAAKRTRRSWKQRECLYVPGMEVV